MEGEVEAEREGREGKAEEVKRKGKEYEETLGMVRGMRSKEEMGAVVEALKEKGLHDDAHPYFVEDSPFYLSTTEEPYLEVSSPCDMDTEGLSFLEIN